MKPLLVMELLYLFIHQKPYFGEIG